MLLTIGFIYILYVYNQNLPPPGRPKVKPPAGLLGQDWPPKFGDQQRLPDMNGGVTEGANINGAADNEEHNKAAEEEQKISSNDMDFDGGDSNNAVENKVEDTGDKEVKSDKSLDVVGEKTEVEAVLPPADGSLVFEGPQVP